MVWGLLGNDVKIGYLLYFFFFIYHVLAHYWIIFFEFQLIRCGALVLIRRIEMAGAGSRNQFNFITHENVPLYLLATSTNIAHDCINALFIDNPQSFSRYPE